MLKPLVRAVLVLACAAGAAPEGETPVSRHAFYRSMDGAPPGAPERAGTRRVFGGAAAALSAFPGTCVLLDRYWGTRCSGAVLASHWVITAAHCVTPHVAYVMYDTRRPKSRDCKTAAVVYLYRHPDYQVREEDEGRGLDVTQLRNDVGLLRTDAAMRLSTAPAVAPPTDLVSGLRVYNLKELEDQEAQVLGFGRTESAALGEQMFEVRLRLVSCERASWQHCMCGVGQPARAGGARGVCSGDSGGPVVFRGLQVLGFGRTESAALGEQMFEVRLRLVSCERASWQHCMCGVGQPARAGGARGVCSGDSGGPVVFRGLQVGVTSMGPTECAQGAADPPESATSVFTSLYQYSELINATMHDAESALSMRRMRWASAGRPARAPPAPPALLAGAALLVRVAR